MKHKAFKIWLEKYTHGELVSQRYELEDAWKAALEWALTTQGRFNSRFCPMISPSIIEKELNAKT